MRLGIKKYTDLNLSHLSPVWGLGRASRQERSAAFRRLHVPPAARFSFNYSTLFDFEPNTSFLCVLILPKGTIQCVEEFKTRSADLSLEFRRFAMNHDALCVYSGLETYSSFTLHPSCISPAGHGARVAAEALVILFTKLSHIVGLP